MPIRPIIVDTASETLNLQRAHSIALRPRRHRGGYRVPKARLASRLQSGVRAGTVQPYARTGLPHARHPACHGLITR